MPNVSRSYLLCFNGSGWILKSKEDVLKQLVQNSASIMYAFVDEHRDSNTLSPHIMAKFDKFDEKRDNEDVVMLGQLHKDAELTIMNNQDNVGVRERAKQFKRMIAATSI